MLRQLTEKFSKSDMYFYIHLIAGIILLILQVIWRIPMWWNLYIYSLVSIITFKFVIEPYTTWIYNTFSGLSERVVNAFSDQIDKGIQKSLVTVKNGLTDIADANTIGFNARTIFKKVGDHYGGLAACIKTAVEAKTASGVGTELIKVGSMLGVEIPIANKISSMMAGEFAAIIPHIEQHSLEDCVPLIATVASMAGAQVTDINVNGFLKDQANNIRNFKVFSDQIRLVLEQAKIITPKNFAILAEINEAIMKLREEYNFMVNTLAVAGHELCKPAGRSRVQKFDNDVQKIDNLLRSINQPEMKNNQIFTDATYIINQSTTILAQCKLLQSQKIRIKPVGICIQGATGIGKSSLVNTILGKVKEKLQKEHAAKFGRAKAWQTWYAQFRDDFDTGYCGQEIMYMDDAFQAKDNSDHLMWIPFISTLPIGCVMAKEKEKGKPFNALICMVTANVLPKTSITAHDINALHTRFPVTIRASLANKVPPVWDPEFKHLKFECGPMSQALDTKKEMPITTIDGIVDRIVYLMCENYNIYQAQKTSVIQNRWEDDEEEEILFHTKDEDDEDDLILYSPPSDSEEEEILADEIEKFRSKHLNSETIPTVYESDEDVDLKRREHEEKMAKMDIEIAIMKEKAATGLKQLEALKEQEREDEARENANILREAARLRQEREQQAKEDADWEKDQTELREGIEKRMKEGAEFERQRFAAEKQKAKAVLCQAQPEYGEQTVDIVGNLTSETVDKNRMLLIAQQRMQAMQAKHRLAAAKFDVPPRPESDFGNMTTSFSDNNGERQKHYMAVAQEINENVPIAGGINAAWKDTYRINQKIAKNLIEAFDAKIIKRPSQLGDWVYFLRRKSDKKLFADVLDEVDEMYSADFLRQLSLWEWPCISAFDHTLKGYGAIRVIDHSDTVFIWSPLIFRGEYLFSPTEEFKEQVIREMLPIHKRWTAKGIIFFSKYWSDPHCRRGIIRYAVATTGMLMPVPAPAIVAAGIFQSTAMWYGNENLREIIQMPVLPDHFRLHPTMRPLIEITRLSEAVFVRLEGTLKIVKDVIYSSFIKVCELIGVDISPFLNDMANLVGDTALQVGVLIFTAVVLYLIWRMIKIIIAKPVIENELELNSGAYDQKRAAKKGKRIQKKIRQIRQHDGSTECKNCKVEQTKNFLNEEYELYHNKNDDNNLYNISFLDIIEDYSEEETNVGRIYQIQKQCALVQVFKAENELEVKKNEICQYRRVESPLEGWAVLIRATLKSSKLFSDLQELLGNYKSINISDYLIDFIIKLEDGEQHLDITVYGLNAEQGGRIAAISKATIAACNTVKENYNKTKVVDKTTIAEIIEHHGMPEAIPIYNKIKEKHQCYLSRVPVEDFDNDKIGARLFGIGHENQIICNAHFAEVGTYFRFWVTTKVPTSYAEYRLAIMTSKDPVRDIAFARILTVQEVKLRFTKLFRLKNDNSSFPSLTPHLYTREKWEQITTHCNVLVNVPMSNLDVPAKATAHGRAQLSVRNAGVQELNYLIVSELTVDVGVAVPGCCGGIVMCTSDRWENRMLGFHSAASNSYWYATILVKEDLEIVKMCDEDNWAKLIVPGEPLDLPPGDERDFVGRYRGTSLPVSKTTLSHWHKSPWFDQFEEQLQPSPLSPNDSRIEVDLPVNQEGRKSLLIAQNEKMCRELPNMKLEKLRIIEDQMITELTCKLRGKVRQVPTNLEEAIYAGLNGARDNIFVTGLRVNKAAGLPWSNLVNGSLKSDYLTCNPATGEVTFNSTKGKILHERVVEKLTKGKAGVRVISLSNSKIKDAPIKISAVKSGKVRVFHSIPVDKMIVDSVVYGNFKESYQREFVKAQHAIGVNPHSRGWEEIYNHLVQHPNIFDCDFANYDKFLHRELLQTVFNIINKTIQNVAPDDWDFMREVLKTESIETFVVDFDTVYKTNRGNKSGEFMTTVVNCIANDILSFYCWTEVTGVEDITSFRQNVAPIFFGDDGVESVSDAAKDLYNYTTVKEVYTAIGHQVTPGSKDGLEAPFTDVDQISFIKRGFKELDGRIVAPLLQRSIESPFVWTELKEEAFDLWEGVVQEKLYEAVLHGAEYYEEFRSKLLMCSNPGLLSHLAPLLSVPFDLKLKDYWKNCYKYE
jgi:hypothetical protein